ncbi:NmrA-like protein [Niveomyces insectorum RCEF 264]|uniref:NmrA-like protein n=1 Tax=Niveomyces insectorum RCEF 264 TaxID=1081102 RepID=A0A167P3E5_9HYPO|nr:NmrA-like protein [Niveomyces insectorum RCEF 264]
MSIHSVTVVGANGNLGGPVLHALRTAGTFRVNVLQRATSKSVVPGESDGTVNVLRVDAWTVERLAHLLRGQDAVVVTFPLRNVDDHLALAEAAQAAGVRRYIPADFGSVDARSERARQLVPLFEKKERVRAKLIELAAAGAPGRFTWTSIVGGHFFDWGLRENFLHANLATHTAEILDDGTARSSLSTLARYGEAVVRILARGADDAATANRVLFIQSFCASQNDVLRALEKATAVVPGGGKPWTVRHIDSGAFIAEHKQKADAGAAASIEELVFALGVIEGDWTQKPDFAMDLLGLKDEDLDAVVTSVMAEYN